MGFLGRLFHGDPSNEGWPRIIGEMLTVCSLICCRAKDTSSPVLRWRLGTSLTSLHVLRRHLLFFSHNYRASGMSGPLQGSAGSHSGHTPCWPLPARTVLAISAVVLPHPRDVRLWARPLCWEACPDAGRLLVSASPLVQTWSFIMYPVFKVCAVSQLWRSACGVQEPALCWPLVSSANGCHSLLGHPTIHGVQDTLTTHPPSPIVLTSGMFALVS